MRLWPRRHGTSLDLLVVGLGNPGREYARNRHNVGWLVVDELAAGTTARGRAKFNGQLAEVRIDGHKVALLKPETYMNDSGRSVQAAMQFFKLEPDAVLVVHDESDLDAGRLQARLGGGLAGHNGLRSVAQHLGTPDFLRLRVGVGPARARRPRPLADCVLSDFEPRRGRRRARRARPRTPSRCSMPRGSRRRSARSTTRRTAHADVAPRFGGRRDLARSGACADPEASPRSRLGRPSPTTARPRLALLRAPPLPKGAFLVMLPLASSRARCSSSALSSPPAVRAARRCAEAGAR